MHRFLFILLTAVFTCGPFISNAWDSSENTQWLQGRVKGDLTDQLTFKLTEQLRYTDNFTYHYYRHTEVGLNWAFASNWAVEPVYRHIMARTRDIDWVSKPTWGVNIRNKINPGPVEIRTRLRLFYTNLDDTRNLTDFRPMITLSPSEGWTSWNLKPFLADELIYNFEDNLIYRNRFGGGLKLAPLDLLSFELFLVQEITRRESSNDWKERYNMGLAATLAF